jgi:group I intron endonuclease
MYSVYAHTNKCNQKKYVGITSCDVRIRWKNGYGYSDKLPIGRAIRKYGWDNFEHSVLADGLSECEAKKMERKLISKWQTQNREYGYNITSGGDGVAGWRPTEETRRKISAASQNRFGKNNPNFGRKWSGEMKRRASIRHCRENLSEETLKKMSESAQGRTGQNNPFYGKQHSQQTKDVLAALRSHAVDAFDKQGNRVFEFPSIKAASEATGVHKTAISNCCRGKTKTSGGYIWKYKTNN